MTDTQTGRSRRGLIPGGTAGWLLLAAAVLVAFVLGMLVSGDGDTPASETHTTAAAESSGPQVWTCSMHPQIKLPKPGKCPICFMDLIPLEASPGEEMSPHRLRMSETARQLAQIQTSPVIRALAEHEVRMVGKLDYDETRLAYITAWVPGRLDRLYADFTGVTVAKGDHMVWMYSPELLAAQEELLQALAAVKQLESSPSPILSTTAQATLEAAREKLRLYGLTEEQIAEIERSGKASDHLTIYAPIGGVVVKKEALEGMYVQTGTRIYTIADLSKLWVRFEAYESDLPWLRYAQHVEFTSPSFPGETFDAIISFIDPVVDPKTRTVKVRAVVDNSDGRLKPDMFVRGIVRSRLNAQGQVVDENLVGKWIGPMHPEIVKDSPGSCDICGMPLVSADSLGYAASVEPTEEAPLLIPASAPLITGKRAVVYVEIPNEDGPLFEGRVIELGPRAGDFYIVRSGLKEGELVVTNGAFKIDSELQIQAKPSMMSPSGGAPAPGHQHGDAPAGQPSGQAPTPMPDQSESHAPSDGQQRLDISAAARRALTPVYLAYFHVQEALAGDDLQAATQVAADLKAAVEQVDMGLFTGHTHQAWMSRADEVSRAAEQIAAAGDLESARKGFLELARGIVALEATFGHADGRDYYVAFCPMADDNRGASWLQTTETVNNPFFGSKMLRCGEIKDTLSPTTDTAE